MVDTKELREWANDYRIVPQDMEQKVIDAANELDRLRRTLSKLRKVKLLYSTYATGKSAISYGKMIDVVLGRDT